MQTNLASVYQGTADGAAAEAILRKCVHCGFCTATCPTYQLLGDELDSPRGRIYLIKQVLEGQAPTQATQTHLDRCLTCRNCESTCPSGVDYGHLVDIGRKLVDAQVPRPVGDRARRWALKEGLNSPFFGPAMRLGQWLRPVLPAVLKAKVPARRPAGAWPTAQRQRRVLMLAGCVQPSMAPSINSATARVLDAAGVQVLVAPEAGCCGAVKFHLNDADGALVQVRANIDAWWPYIEGAQAVESIVMNASGCGVMVKDYGHLLRDDPLYAAKAARVSALCQDVSELLPDWVGPLKERLAHRRKAQQGPEAALPALVFHPPCTLQHGQKLRGGVEEHMSALGFTVRLAHSETHLCCGSAGTYSVLNPGLSATLRDRKLGHLNATPGEIIISANMGCIAHLQSGTDVAVRHWIEVLDAALHGD